MRWRRPRRRARGTIAEPCGPVPGYTAGSASVAHGAPAPVICPNTHCSSRTPTRCARSATWPSWRSSLSVVGDDTPLGKAASDVSSSPKPPTAAFPSATTTTETLVRVSGWDDVSHTFGASEHLCGMHLAPWLLHGPVVNSTVGRGAAAALRPARPQRPHRRVPSATRRRCPDTGSGPAARTSPRDRRLRPGRRHAAGRVRAWRNLGQSSRRGRSWPSPVPVTEE